MCLTSHSWSSDIPVHFNFCFWAGLLHAWDDVTRVSAAWSAGQLASKLPWAAAHHLPDTCTSWFSTLLQAQASSLAFQHREESQKGTKRVIYDVLMQHLALQGQSLYVQCLTSALKHLDNMWSFSTLGRSRADLSAKGSSEPLANFSKDMLDGLTHVAWVH